MADTSTSTSNVERTESTHMESQLHFDTDYSSTNTSSGSHTSPCSFDPSDSHKNG